jgi:formylmethanofuran dehydrogenase subunit E
LENTTLARILLLLAIGFAIWLLFKAFMRKQMKPPTDASRPESEDMVACSRCGVNMPRSEAREAGGKFTCRDPASCKHSG